MTVGARGQTVDKSWIGSNAEKLFQEAAGIKMAVVNDADAAGYAEMAFGAGSGEEKTKGIVMMLTFGTGIGTAMFVDGILVRHLRLKSCMGIGTQGMATSDPGLKPQGLH